MVSGLLPGYHLFLGPDPGGQVNLRHSQGQTVIEGHAIRLSLSDVHGFGPE
jgi:hypothetical protein